MRSTMAFAGNISPASVSVGIFSGAFMNDGNEICKMQCKVTHPVGSSNLLPLKQLISFSMIYSIFNKPLLRLLFFVILSFPLRLILDVMFGLVYRNYALIRPLEEYLGSVILTVLTLESVQVAKRMIGRRFPWENNPLKRLFIEIGVNTSVFSVVIVTLSLSINFLILKSQLIILSDEFIKTIFYLIFLVQGPAFIEFAVFLLRKWQTSLAEMEKYRKENAEYRFETLRTQVNPHFLFNSLNTLSGLVYEDREKAVGFIRELSDVYRYVLDNRSRETTQLNEEIKFIRSFVFLYQLRFDNKLNVEFDVSDSDLGRLIAPMTLQLLVENAVKHNVISVRKPLTIHISTEEGKYLTVRNNLQKKTTEVVSSEIGLKNISSRYAYLTTKPVEVTETETEFIVKVPLI
ncbi:MAG: histidine kinase [Bacteroidales bacterium]|nr:histidine kinase [Bacteroidales bacterium]